MTPAFRAFLRPLRLVPFVAIAVFGSSGTRSEAIPITYEMVPVGDIGNPSDDNGHGSVGFEYKIGKFEVTIAQYLVFLNSVAADDTFGLFDSQMESDPNVSGIRRIGDQGRYRYEAVMASGSGTIGGGDTNRPIAYISWFRAARFANWMSNNQPSGVQDATTTENGAYDLTQGDLLNAPNVNSINPNTSIAPEYAIPTIDQWYKAAYYCPYLNSGTGGYYDYATQSDVDPGNEVGGKSNQANLIVGGTFAVTQLAMLDSAEEQNYLTAVGAFLGSPSYYGTFDQTGNVIEWSDLPSGFGLRGLEGGHWAEDSAAVRNSYIDGRSSGPMNALGMSGFRLASPVPEPAPWMFGGAGGILVWWQSRRRSCRRSTTRFSLCVSAHHNQS